MSEKNIYSNPFPASGVARLSSAANELLTITTDAVKKGLSYLDDYLDRSGVVNNDVGQSESHGNVIAIVGEYGTGKTHIALELLNRIISNGTPDIHIFYLDAPADSFMALYKERFIPKLLRADVRDRVREYLSDIIAKELEKSVLTKAAAQSLRERKISPLELVRSLGLMESEFRQRLNEQLGEVTENKDFGTAFSLFLRPEFEDAVWEWLQGAPPDAALVDRGISRTLNDDPAVLETIGVFAFLYGRQNHRFVLVIDEMEKVLSHSQRTDEATVLAFKKLMEVMGKTRALLILCGLPDFMEVLPEDAQQRILSIVRPTGLSPSDTEQYIREAQKRATGRERLKPFTKDTVAYVSEIAGGNARKVVRLCYHAFQAAVNSGTDITRAMLRETAREQFELTTKEDVYTEISRTVDLNGWLFEANKIVGESKIKADFWLPVGDRGSGCAIFISRSLLHEQDTNALIDKIQLIDMTKSQEVKILSLLIINGYLADNLASPLRQAFDRVMSFSVRRFSDDVDAALKGLVRRLEDSYNEDNVVIIRDRVEQLSRQTQSTRYALANIEQNMLDAGLVKGAVEQGLRSIFGQLGGGATDSIESDPKYRKIKSEFDRVETKLQDSDKNIDLFLNNKMFVSNDGYDREIGMHPVEYTSLNNILKNDELRDYLNSINLALKLVSTFRKRIFLLLSEISYENKTSRFIHKEVQYHDSDLNYELVRRMCGEMEDLLESLFRGVSLMRDVDFYQHNLDIKIFNNSDMDNLLMLPHRVYSELKKSLKINF